MADLVLSARILFLQLGHAQGHLVTSLGIDARVQPLIQLFGAGAVVTGQVSLAEEERRLDGLGRQMLGDRQLEDRIVDNMCMQLIQKPELYDVIVLPNLYGDIVSDLCAGLVGGLGMAPGANIGEKGAIFEATHGSAPKYKGQNKVNPVALILSGVMMLNTLGKTEEADKLEKAVAAVIAEGKSVTYDMKPDRDDPTAVGTSQMADAIIEKVKG